jgi:hypothetical protein
MRKRLRCRSSATRPKAQAARRDGATPRSGTDGGHMKSLPAICLLWLACTVLVAAQEKGNDSGKAPLSKGTAAQKDSAPRQAREVFTIRAGKNGGTVLVAVKPEQCEEVQNMGGSLDVSGVAGDKARLDIKCGDKVIGTCTAIVPALPALIGRCEIEDTGVVPGKADCPVTLVKGKPTWIAKCDGG